MKSRMTQRAKDKLAVSDGRWEIYQQQKKLFVAPTELGDSLIEIETSDSPELLVKQLEQRLAAKQA